ncbi:MAG: nucleotidyltransferase family protein [Thermoplasmatota archaeon]
MNKEEIYEDIAQYLKKEGAEKVAIFGSYVHDNEGPDSDIDVLVKFSETKSLLELVRMERELSEQIGIKVDLLTEKSLSPYIRDNVHKEMREVYG